MFTNVSFMQVFISITIALFFSSTGFFVGVYDEKNKFKNFEVTSDLLDAERSSCNIPVISINQIENGILNISQFENTELRILVNNNEKTLQILDKNTENIDIDVVAILPKTEKVPAPQWANFVASKRGTTFWPLDAPRAFILTPKNRIFFATKESALAKKYKAGVR